MHLNFYEYFKHCLIEDKLPHAFLLESNNIENTYDNIINLLYTEKLIKNSDYSKNLNFILIEPDGNEIQTNQITYLKDRFSTIPTYDNFNIYIIKNAEKMNISSSNKLLKFLEEPNKSIIGILLMDYNLDVLETIKSRCQYFLIEEENKSNLIQEDSEELFNYIFENKNIIKEIEFKKRLSKLERKNIIILFEELLKKSEVIFNDKIETNNFKNHLKNIFTIDKILHLFKSNVNIDLVLDIFFIELRY